MGEDDNCYLSESESDDELYLSEVIKDDFDLFVIDMMLRDAYNELK